MAEIPRDNHGRFGAGNPGGKLKTGEKHRKIAAIARDLLEEHGYEQARKILSEEGNVSAKVRLFEILLERAFGKAPMKVKHGLDRDSAEYWLLKMAGQPIPGEGEDDEEDEQ